MLSTMRSLIQAAAGLFTGKRAVPVTKPPRDYRPRSRWTCHTKSPYNCQAAKARRKMAHESRRRNRAA